MRKCGTPFRRWQGPQIGVNLNPMAEKKPGPHVGAAEDLTIDK